MSNDKWMQNPYVFPGVNVSPSLTPIHVKRRSESHSSSHPSQYSSMSSSGNNNPPSGKLSSKRPSTAGTSVYSSSVYASSTISGGSNSSGSGTVTIGPTKIRYPYTVLKRGKKHHAFPTQAVPYPLNYENRILDCDSLFVNTASPSLSPFIDNSNPATHPRRVLDVGCGTGAWCLKAAQYWPNTRFVGLDLVAIQPESYVTCMQRIEGICKRVKEGKGSKANAPKIPTIGLPRKSTSSSNTTSTTQLKPLSSTTSFGSAPFSSSSSLSGHTIPKPPVSSTSSTPNTSPITPPSAAHPQPSSATLPPSTSPSSSLPPTSPLNPHPRSQQRQTSQLLASSHDRVNWVHHNFLSKAGLPFRNEEFDLIRVCGIAHGVPEDSPPRVPQSSLPQFPLITTYLSPLSLTSGMPSLPQISPEPCSPIFSESKSSALAHVQFRGNARPFVRLSAQIAMIPTLCLGFLPRTQGPPDFSQLMCF
ncbi:hypothetical protein FRC16_004359 [Serendipita sp. 398]|nr:hypothetical protein FRC16_004359 [Serendipita sp. 398]